MMCEFECATIIQKNKEIIRNMKSRAKSYKHEIEYKKTHVGILLDAPIQEAYEQCRTRRIFANNTNT